MARRLRVATIHSSLIIGGDASRLLAYLAARDRDRFDHIIFGGMSSSSEWEDLCGPIWKRFRALDVEIVDLGISVRHFQWKRASAINRTADQFRTYIRLIRQIARALREREIDIVDGRMEMGTVVATLAGRLAGVKAVLSTKYTPWTGGERWFRRNAPLPWSLFGQGIYAFVDAVICDSVTCLNAIRQGLILPPPGYCIPNGIEPPRSERSREEMATEIGIPSGARVVAQIARLQPTKGQDLLLEAAPLVLAQQPDAFFLVVGYSGHTQVALDYRDRLDRIVKTKGVGDRVRIVSYPGSIGDIWSLVDVHAHPTRLDSSPISLLESMSLGKPAVTSRIGGIPELVVDGETGIILPPNDTRALANAILRLLQDPGEAARLGRNARQRYEAGYTPGVMARRIEDVFEQVYAAPRIRRRSSA
jgi:glycosyltransferase involved in cell wall biosynthesis